MTSHEYADHLKQAAEFLLSRPEFKTPSITPYVYLGSFWSQKDGFLAAVKACGTVVKEWDATDLKIRTGPNNMITFWIQRSLVCKKVQEEKWECEPLLSPEEEASIEAPAE